MCVIKHLLLLSEILKFLIKCLVGFIKVVWYLDQFKCFPWLFSMTISMAIFPWLFSQFDLFSMYRLILQTYYISLFILHFSIIFLNENQEAQRMKKYVLITSTTNKSNLLNFDFLSHPFIKFLKDLFKISAYIYFH